MTHEELIEALKEQTIDLPDDCSRYMDFALRKSDIEMLIAALERQIPRKPNGIFCPVCNFPSIIDREYGDRYPYCHNCGQAIDWTEE